MREVCHISFCVPVEEAPRLRRMLHEIGCDEGWMEPTGVSVLPGFSFVYDSTDSRLSAMTNLLRREGIDYSERRESIYTRSEQENACLLELIVTARERDVERPVRSQFDFTRGCPRCGTGAPLVRPLRIRTTGIPAKALIFQTTNDHYLVTGMLHMELATANLSGLALMPVVSTSDEPLAWWCMCSTHIMPPMAPETRGIIRSERLKGCAECGRDNWFHTRKDIRRIAYRRSQLADWPLPDLAHTWECFGISAFDANGFLAQPLLLVSPRVVSIFRILKVRGVDFEPVTILDK